MHYEMTIRSEEGITESQAEEIFDVFGDDFDSADWDGTETITVDGTVPDRLTVAHIIWGVRKVFGWRRAGLDISTLFD